MRDCKNCVHYTPDGCESWDCEYINRAEAIECYEIVKAMREMGETYGKGEPMSILIKGIDMPKSCGGCEFNYCLEGGSYEWRECVILHDDINQFDTRRTDCPLIEIPTPHGRLVDANDIKAKCINEVFESMGTVAITDPYPDDEWADDICDVPTILEEEK